MPELSTTSDGKHAGIAIAEIPGGAVISLRGDHDLSTKPQLVNELTQLRRAPWAVIVIDLRRCTFVDSSVIGAILAAHRQDASQPNISVVLPDDTSYVYRALALAGLATLVPAHASIEAALAATADAGMHENPGADRSSPRARAEQSDS